jgi:chromosome partitioning protein
MKTIVFAKTKGGTGGSTLCYNAAIYAAASGAPVRLIDRDPQESLTKMWVARSELINPLLIYGVKSMAQSVKFLPGECEFLFVDTPGSMMSIIADAVSVADLIVVPTQPRTLDLEAQDALLDLIEQSNLAHRTLFVLTRTSQAQWGVKLVEEAKRQLRKFSPHPIPLMPERIDYERAIAAGKGKAAFEISKSDDVKTEIEEIWGAMRKAMKKASVAAGTVEARNVQLTR